MNNPADVRKRMVNFRATNDEYQLLLKESRASGSRSVSDYARWALLGSMRHMSLLEDDETPRDFKRLDERLTRLESSIHRVLELLTNSTLGQCARTQNRADLPLSEG